MNLRDMLLNLDVKKLMEADNRIWRATLRVGDSVPANQALPTTLNVSDRGLFLCCSITGRFTTLINDETVQDNGVCALSFTMVNGSGRVYIQDPIYMDSFLTPGRVKSDLATNNDDAAPSGVLEFPGIEFLTLFQPKDDITFKVDNAANTENSWQMSLHGFWIKK